MLIFGASLITALNLPSEPSYGFAMFWGHKVWFWTDLLLIAAGASIIGVFAALMVFRKKKRIGVTILLWVLISLFAIPTIYLAYEVISDYKSTVPEVAFKSPDGEHILYYDGGDSDIFGNSSGYEHYAMKTGDYTYERIFFTFEEEYEPQIDWGNNGFTVAKKCPEGYDYSDADLVPETHCPVVYEVNEDSYFFYYEPK